MWSNLYNIESICTWTNLHKYSVELIYRPPVALWRVLVRKRPLRQHRAVTPPIYSGCSSPSLCIFRWLTALGTGGEISIRKISLLPRPCFISWSWDYQLRAVGIALQTQPESRWPHKSLTDCAVDHQAAESLWRFLFHTGAATPFYSPGSPSNLGTGSGCQWGFDSLVLFCVCCLKHTETKPFS